MKRAKYLVGVVGLICTLVSPSVIFANVEGKNLQAFTLRQFNVLLLQIEEGRLYSSDTSILVDKITSNLDELCTYLHGPLQVRDFNRITERLESAIANWENAQFLDARFELLKARTLLASFGF